MKSPHSATRRPSIALRPATRFLLGAGLLLGMGAANAADTLDTACRTTEECQAQVARLQGTVKGDATSALAKQQDVFYWFGRINMASTVVLTEQGIIPAALTGRIARGVSHSIDQAAQPGGKRPTDVLQVEKIITDQVGPEGTLVHTGRSRQDIHSTLNAAQLRLEVLDYADALDAVRKRLIDLAGKHVDTYVPAYTNGVQAMPISYAHYLLAFADSFERDATRIREAYARLNLSPMGTAVLANSSWSVNRERLAALLGFDGLIVNSLDAGQISTYDIPLEATAIASSTAIRVGAFLQDVHTQYHQTRPWMLLGASDTYTSSAMPQKANPGVIQNTRAKATDVVASAQAVTLRAHNVTPGMIDYKNTASATGAKTFVLGVEMLQQFDGVLGALQIDRARALEELESDWITSMELAETLQRAHGVPFRVGHHFASEIVVYARSQNLRPKDFPYAQAQRIYAEAGQKYQLSQAVLPLDEAAFRATLSPATMVRTRTGTGGPQPEEVRRMLASSSAALARDQTWAKARRARLIEAEAALNRSFVELARKP
ncbi:argininosuccinate lyase [Variovorax guangxiensis]|uniref:argininosuccinate lyase n=1 Tax=Variovorax guangxiensis TaxID=1775474 RepID=A0A502DWE8_9BURK|nr:argininosuccinate lyase [Variovorax guangxiensis]TPG24401.1 argininosuccinate lyase [Variovorax ginsengisoli]TPG28651.1 argininosuccinate lyase [Variovorax guangxiensis]